MALGALGGSETKEQVGRPTRLDEAHDPDSPDGPVATSVEAFGGVDLGDLSLSKPAGRTRRRSGRERRGKPVGRYLMCVHVRPHATQIAVLEGRTLVEHFVSRASDDTSQIDGNIYLGRVQNVLPGMEAAFIDIDTPKNAVLYRGDVRYDREDIETQSSSASADRADAQARTDDRVPGHEEPDRSKGCTAHSRGLVARSVRRDGPQFVRLRHLQASRRPRTSPAQADSGRDQADRPRPDRPHGGGAARASTSFATTWRGSCAQWAVIEAEAGRANSPRLLYREPDLGVRIVREELNNDYRAVIIDDRQLYEQVRDYVAGVNPELVDRIELYDTRVEPLPLFERYHVHEQLHKALDRKVWLPSGGSIIIERTEALTVIDVNTGKNVGTSNLEETVFRNNLEAAEEIARQLRLRDIGGIIVIDFIDMEVRENRDKVGAALRAALGKGQDKGPGL